MPQAFSTRQQRVVKRLNCRCCGQRIRVENKLTKICKQKHKQVIYKHTIYYNIQFQGRIDTGVFFLIHFKFTLQYITNGDRLDIKRKHIPLKNQVTICLGLIGEKIFSIDLNDCYAVLYICIIVLKLRNTRTILIT